MMSLLSVGVALAADNGADFSVAHTEVTGQPLYRGPVYKSIDSQQDDISVGEPFHSFMHAGVDDIGYSPLTLDDFRYPVAGRTKGEFSFERLQYPEQSVMVWHDDCNNFTVNAFFFTRDMVRDHIQRLIDEYYICEPALVQQMIDYYAEVTPQCGEAISWVWFQVDEKGHHYADYQPNRYFERYLYNLKDKFYLEFGFPKAQAKVDSELNEFLYQYEDRGRFNCGPEFKERVCADGSCNKCASCVPEVKECKSCPDFECKGDCPEMKTVPHDEALYCDDFGYKGFSLNVNDHYLYYPRKVVIEDMTYDPVARAYRWKFAWRFTDCEIDWLRQMCAYGKDVDFSLVISDPHWYAKAPLNNGLERSILGAMDPQTWGNVWAAGNVPFDMTCCECLTPACDGNCQAQPEVGWTLPAEPEPTPPVVTPPPPPMPPLPPPPAEPEQPIEVEGRG